LVDYARTGYGQEITLSQAKELHRTYRARWPEMADYFRFWSSMAGADVAERLVFVRSGLVRGKVPYTALCNSNFQHLAAMGAKEALYYVSKECYLDTKSPLYGARPVLFLHDEAGLEVPYSDPVRASRAADRLREIMIERMSVWVPDVPITATPVMTTRWRKGARPVYIDGLLVPSRPIEKDGRIIWEADLPERRAA
jgi:hypothetical protein